MYSAIMEYHSLKMQEINKIIRELWYRTYRGTGNIIFKPNISYQP